MFHPIIEKLGLDRDDRVVAYSADSTPASDYQITYNPTTGEPLAAVKLATRDDYDRMMKEAVEAFDKWRMVPAPIRGELVRQCGLALREHQEAIGELVSLEMGKIRRGRSARSRKPSTSPTSPSVSAVSSTA
jgi:aldehyde dehydrogenase (NAD+)